LTRLAERVPCGISHLGQIENDNKAPSIELLDRICAALGVRRYLVFCLAEVDQLDPAMRSAVGVTLLDALDLSTGTVTAALAADEATGRTDRQHGGA